MKKILFLSVSLFSILLAASCSKETDDIITEIDPFENLEPYISPQMQEILSMLDTATVALPLSVVIPGIDDYLAQASDTTFTPFLQTRAVGDFVTIVGHSTYSVPQAKRQIELTPEQATAFNVRGSDGKYNTGPYYITFFIATQNVINPGGLPIPVITNQDIIGFHPDKPAEWGYAVTEVVKNVYYQLTTYLYAIHGENQYGPMDQIYDWVPFNSRFRDIYKNSSSGAWDLVILRGLEWNYVVGPN